MKKHCFCSVKALPLETKSNAFISYFLDNYNLKK